MVYTHEFLAHPPVYSTYPCDTGRPVQDPGYARVLSTMRSSQAAALYDTAEIGMPHEVRQQTVASTANLSFMTNTRPVPKVGLRAVE